MKGFVKISKYAGMREDLVQAGGGNSSYKLNANRMAIKASGYQLSEVTEKDGYSFVDCDKLKASFIGADDLTQITEADGNRILAGALIEGKRPSIETFLHAISETYTLHTHPIVVNAMACRKTWKDELSQLFPDALYVPYATPGIELAKKFFAAYKSYGEDRIPEVIFLQNHGLVVSAESADDVILKTEEVVTAIERYLGCNLTAYHDLTAIWKLFPQKILWKVTDRNVLDVMEKHEGMLPHVFCPDYVVFLGKRALNLPEHYTEKDLIEFVQRYGEPVMVFYRKNLYIAADNVKKAMEIQSILSASAQVMNLDAGIECNLLSEIEQDFLLNWDAEKYRKKL